MTDEEIKRLEKEAAERSKDFSDNEKSRAAYECGYMDGYCKRTEEEKE